MFSGKNRSRRQEIRKNRPDTAWIDWEKWRQPGVSLSVGIACGFFIIASGILMFRQDVVPYRPGQWLNHDIVSRVNFHYNDKARLEEKQKEARARAPRVYQANGDVWRDAEEKLDQLPELVAGQAGPPTDLQKYFDSGAVTALRRSATAGNRDEYIRQVANYVDFVRQYRVLIGGKSYPITILPEFERAQETRLRKPVTLSDMGVMDSTRTFSIRSTELRDILANSSRTQFLLALQPAMVQYTLSILQPTHVLDEGATTVAAEAASREVNPREGDVFYAENQVLVYKSKHDGRALDKASWYILQAEHHEYIRSLRGSRWISRAGVVGVVLAITFVLCCYIGFYETRILRNHTRQTAIASLLLSMLLLNQIAAIGDGPIYLFGLAPTLLVAMIITIAYDQRSAMGIASMHALLATIALNQNVAFFVVLWVGVLTVCFLLDDIRTRSKLIEVGGASALAMAAVTAAAGLLAFDPWEVIQQNCLFAAAAGLGVGFVVLGILPFIEKAFKITTSMTLLEMADISQPLLRRLQLEAPGTYSHSLQVAALSEAAAESIGANSLLCRVASYYHDVGKINKADYFCENQANGENRHMSLSPSVSLLIIIGHVKDGVELAREYNLPSSIVPFIQQHHGTTLVRYFFHQARTQQEQQQPDMPAVCDTQYRYPGPKPKTREVAIVMLADAIESASRTMGEATPSRIESLIHDIAQNRLLDGQFDECDITMRELEQIERSLMKTLTGIYHGRVVYPSMKPEGAEAEPAPAATTAVRSA